MESKKINQLATELSPVLSDLTIIGDPTTGISKKITLSQMASLFTGTVEEYPNLASFPLVGTADTIYIALDTNVLYRWNTGTNAYVELSPNIINSLVFNDANGFDGTIALVGSVATLTITTALTTGSVGFIGASGALLQDNANFFWDDTNNRLGLGTNAPTTAIDVFGSGIIGRLNGTSTNNAYLGFASAGSNKWSIGNVQSDHRFRIYNEATTSELVTVLQTGEFGIGIANPTTKFHIDGGASALIANLDANVSVAKSLSFRSDNSNRFNIEVSGTESGSNAGADFFIRRYSDAGSLIDTPFTILRSSGNIGIGNVAPNSPLHILSSTVGLLARFESNQAESQIRIINTGTSGRSYSIGSGASTSAAINGFYIYDENSTTTRLAINSSGNIGIGTTTYGERLSVYGNPSTDCFGFFSGGSGTTLGGIKIGNNGSTYGSLYWDNALNDVLLFHQFTSGALRFGTNSTERARIDIIGNLYIGNTTFTSPNSADKFIGVYGGQDCSLILQDAVQTWELYVNDDFYISRGATSAFSISRTNGAASFASNLAVNGNTEVQNGNKLSVYRTDNTRAIQLFTDNNACYVDAWEASSEPLRLRSNGSGGRIEFHTNTSEKARFTSTGALLINTTTLVGSDSRLNVYSDGAGPTFTNASSGQQSFLLWNTGTTGNNLWVEFHAGSSLGTKGSIDYNRGSNVTRYNTTSDANLKNIIGDSNKEKSIDILSSTKIREYSWKNDETNKPQIGVIAQELYQTFKGAVSVGSDEELFGTEDYKNWGVDKTAFTFHLIAGWQKHQEIIENLEARIKQLEVK